MIVNCKVWRWALVESPLNQTLKVEVKSTQNHPQQFNPIQYISEEIGISYNIFVCMDGIFVKLRLSTKKQYPLCVPNQNIIL